MSGFDLIGPIERRDVIVNGWRVPFLQGHPVDGGRVLFTADDRFAYDATVQEAERLVPFLADVIATALGYTSHPSGETAPRPSTPFARTRSV